MNTMTNHPALERAREILAGWDRDADFAKVEARRRENRIAEIMARPPAPDGTQWRDIGDGWEELSITPPPGDRVIRGIASTKTINSHNYSVYPMGMETKLPIPLRSSHALQGKGIGSVYLFRRNAAVIYYEATVGHGIAEDYAWEKIESGYFQGVSLGWEDNGHHMQIAAIVDGTRFYDKWYGGELSLCKKGANPDCTCSIHDGRPWREYLDIVAIQKAKANIVYKETVTQ